MHPLFPFHDWSPLQMVADWINVEDVVNLSKAPYDAHEENEDEYGEA